MLWYGAIGAIPAGYVLCDGNNGTPNLQNKFIVGAGDTYPVDDTGGSVQHNHAFTGDGHSHTIPAGTNIAGGGTYAFWTDTDPAVGTTDDTNHLPPYHALAYIMKT